MIMKMAVLIGFSKLLLLSVLSVQGQTLIGHNDLFKFYIYPTSITRTSSGYIVTAKTISKNYVRHDLILGNCRDKSWMIITSQTRVGKQVSWYTANKHLKKLQSTDKSAILYITELLCQLPIEEEFKNETKPK